MTSPAAPGPGGDVGLDPDLARVAIQKLMDVRNQLVDALNDAESLARVPESAHDAVSKAAFALLREKAIGGPGSMAWALEGGIEYLDRVINQMEADLAQLESQDTAAAHTIDQS